MFSRKQKKKKGFQRKRKRTIHLSTIQKQLLIGVGLFICMGLILTGVWYFVRIPSLQIKQVQVIGGFTIPHAQIEDIANSDLSGTYLHYIPKRFRFTYPQKQIYNDVASLDRVKHVDVERSASDTVAVAFEEYRPYALWCAPEGSDTPCMFIDRAGYAFAQSPKLTGSAFVRYSTDDVSPKKQTQAFDPAFVDTTRTFAQKAQEQLDLYIVQVHQIGDYDIEYAVSGGGIIKVSQKMSANESFDNLKTILNSKQFSDIQPGAFQYIDLRFGDKVFINEETATSSATSTDAQEE